MKKKVIFIIIVLAVAAAAFFIIYQSAEKNNKNALYIQGCEYIENGDFANAADCFSKLSGYLDSDELYAESYYQSAISLKDEDPGQALAMFEEIANYRESASYIDSILYELLNEAIDAHDLDQAENYAQRIPAYQDVPYKQEYISYLRYLDFLDQNDTQSADAVKSRISDASLKTKAERIYEYSTHGAAILSDLKGRFETEGAVIDIKEVRCYQYAYNNNVEVPVYLVFAEYTDAAGNKIPRYIAYMDMTYYGFCDTIVRAELNMQDEQQLYAFLKIGPFWDEESTYVLSTGLMKALAGL